jgi:restriction endonuclease Mrr
MGDIYQQAEEATAAFTLQAGGAQRELQRLADEAQKVLNTQAVDIAQPIRIAPTAEDRSRVDEQAEDALSKSLRELAESLVSDDLP